VAFLQQGPPAARISRVEAIWHEANGEWHTFGVRFL
jgi:hypothetical protein